MNSALAIATTVAGIAILKSTPLIYAALGGVISENAGVVNIGLEGMMAGGAFAAVLASYYTHSLPAAVIAGAFVGGALALVLAYFAIALRANQIIVGMALNVFAVGAAALLLTVLFGQPGTSPEVRSFSSIASSSGPGIAATLHYALVWMALGLVLCAHVILYRTRVGLHLRAVGEQPRAAAVAGIDVMKIRYVATVLGGVLAGLGGAYLSVGEVDLYSDGMVAGRGFIALAAVIFGKWTPLGSFGACLFFGLFSSLQIALQRATVPAQLLEMLPYALTIVALAGFIGRSRPPASDGVPYEP
ncbi:MAG: ABC transporter permease [Candidatus Eremiobacteraeota bacterium]|nr:ABC transporter permease [Candidatus Eremiobacteraeota bacterium]MBC5826549.1 ABC transporter permease [Candidatus Eremiobacteraeota bacterium]